MLDKLRGIRTPAWLTGALRGIIEAAAFAALYAGFTAVSDASLPDNYKWVAIAAPFVLRSVEGFIDQVDPTKIRRREAADKVS